MLLKRSNLRIHATNYNSSWYYVNRNGLMHSSIYDYIRAALTFGCGSLPHWLNRKLKYHIPQLGMCFSTIIMLNWDTDLSIVPEYRYLDSSLKILYSCWYGMVFTKLAAESVMGIPWLQYCDPLIANHTVIMNRNTMQRPDFIGQDIQGGWHVFEAKGRSSNITRSVLQNAKKQVNSVGTINGQAPATRSVSGVDISHKPIQIHLMDPDNNDDQPYWDMTDEGFFSTYYQGLISFIKEESHEIPIDGDTVYIGRKFTALSNELTIALPQEIIDNPAITRKIQKKVFSNRFNISSRFEYASLGRDCVFLYSQEKFQLSKDQRREIVLRH